MLSTTLELLEKWRVASRDYGTAQELVNRLLVANADFDATKIARQYRDELAEISNAAGDAYFAARDAEDKSRG